MQEIVTVTVPNWEKFNPRKDRKNHSWFRFQNSFFTDQKVFALSTEQQRLLIFIYCQRSEKETDSVELSTSYLAAILRRKTKEISSDIHVLFESKLITVTTCQPTDNQTPSNGSPTYVRTYVRTREPNRTAPERDLNESQRHLNAPEPSSSSSKKETTHTSTEECVLLEAWNKNCGSLPKVERLTINRKSKIKRLWSEKPDPGYWVEVVQKIAKSPFCNGSGQTGWRANFDWLLRPETHLKVIEGNYSNKTHSLTRLVAD